LIFAKSENRMDLNFFEQRTTCFNQRSCFINTF